MLFKRCVQIFCSFRAVLATTLAAVLIVIVILIREDGVETIRPFETDVPGPTTQTKIRPRVEGRLRARKTEVESDQIKSKPNFHDPKLFIQVAMEASGLDRRTQIEEIFKYISEFSAGGGSSVELIDVIDEVIGYGDDRAYLMAEVFSNWTPVTDFDLAMKRVEEEAESKVEASQYYAAYLSGLIDSGVDSQKLKSLISGIPKEFSSVIDNAQSRLADRTSGELAAEANAAMIAEMLGSGDDVDSKTALRIIEGSPVLLFRDPNGFSELPAVKFRPMINDFISNNLHSVDQLIQAANSMDICDNSQYFVKGVILNCLRQDSYRATNLISQFDEGPKRNSAISAVVEYSIKNRALDEANAWVGEIQDDVALKTRLIEEIDKLEGN